MMKKREEERKKEKEALQNKIWLIEEKGEKKNIIIKNTDMEGNELTKEVKQFINSEMKIDVEVTEAYELRKGIVLAKLKKRSKKRNMMTTKNMLKETQIYIEDDLTYKERQIQRKLRKIARSGKQMVNK